MLHVTQALRYYCYTIGKITQSRLVAFEIVLRFCEIQAAASKIEVLVSVAAFFDGQPTYMRLIAPFGPSLTLITHPHPYLASCWCCCSCRPLPLFLPSVRWKTWGSGGDVTGASVDDIYTRAEGVHDKKCRGQTNEFMFCAYDKKARKTANEKKPCYTTCCWTLLASRIFRTHISLPSLSIQEHSNTLESNVLSIVKW